MVNSPWKPNNVAWIRNTGNKHGQLRIAIGTKIAITLKQTKCSGLFIGCGVWREKMMNRWSEIWRDGMELCSRKCSNGGGVTNIHCKNKWFKWERCIGINARIGRLFNLKNTDEKNNQQCVISIFFFLRKSTKGPSEKQMALYNTHASCPEFPNCLYVSVRRILSFLYFDFRILKR